MEKQKSVTQAGPAQEKSWESERVQAELRRFVDLVLRETRLALSYEIQAPHLSPTAPDDPEIVVSFRGPDEELVLQHQAELLLALEHLALRWLDLPASLQHRIRFDSGDFRAQRVEELRLSAKVAAQRVRETHQSFRFSPMSSRERRTIHLALHGAPGVRTTSEGAGEHRHIVIYPADAPK